MEEKKGDRSEAKLIGISNCDKKKALITLEFLALDKLTPSKSSNISLDLNWQWGHSRQFSSYDSSLSLQSMS